MALRDFLRRTLATSLSAPDVVKTTSHPLHAFGKLPFYKDFISCGLTDTPSREFRDFVSDGFSRRWCSRDGWNEVPIPAHSFLLRLPGSGRSVAGSLWGSADQGSLRKFPFTLFAVVGGDAVDPVSSLDYLDDFERHAGKLRHAGAGQTLQSFYDAYRGARIELGIRSRQRVGKALEPLLADVPVSRFAGALLGAGREAAFPRLVSWLRQASGPDGAGAVRIPLANGLSPALQLSFWLMLLEGKGGPAATGVLYSWDTSRPRGALLYRAIHPEDFLLLHPSATDYERVEEPPAELRAEEAAVEAGETPGAAGGLRGSLAELLSSGLTDRR